jgi:hypothetical protein
MLWPYVPSTRVNKDVCYTQHVSHAQFLKQGASCFAPRSWHSQPLRTGKCEIAVVMMQDLWEQAWALYLMLTRLPVAMQPDLKMLCLLAKGMPVNNRSAVISAQILSDARSVNLQLSPQILQALLSALCLAGCWHEAVAVVRPLEDCASTAVPLLHQLNGFLDEQDHWSAAADHARLEVLSLLFAQ